MPDTPSPSRLPSVDALRGAIIMIMAIDHVRDYVSVAAMSFEPTNLSRTTAALFFTRWITHFCAPVFAFTAGLGAFFWYQRGHRTKAELSRFLLTRGLWLVALELTAMRFIMFFEWRFRGQVIVLLVLWMLGLSMVALAALAHVPPKILAPVSLLIILTHNLFDGIDPTRFGRLAPIWDILHQPAAIPFHGMLFFVAYPLIPWISVMALGFCLGPVLLWEFPRRQKFLIGTGSALFVLFILLRSWNHYGDAARWSHQPSALFTLLSFLNTTKYPPSLLFLLMTLGPSLIAMALLERRRLSLNHPAMVFGRVPFFFFLLHFTLAHVIAVALGALRYGPQHFLLLAPPSIGGPSEAFPPGYGFSLPVVYLVWLSVLVISYPLCRWYADLKQRRRDLWWLSYL